MKRLLITLFSTGLLLSTVQVRPESQMLNWTKNELSKVAWGQGASAVAGDAKAVGSFVYSQMPSKQAVINTLVAGKDIAKQALISGKSFVRSNAGCIFSTGLLGVLISARWNDAIDKDVTLTYQEKQAKRVNLVKYGFLPSLALMGLSVYSATR